MNILKYISKYIHKGSDHDELNDQLNASLCSHLKLNFLPQIRDVTAF